MKDGEEKNDLLLNEENMTHLGFSEEVKQYVRERQDIHRETLKQKEEEKYEKMVQELDRERSVIHQFKEVNKNLHKIQEHHLNKLQEILDTDRDVGNYIQAIDKNLADFKSDISHRVEDNIYLIKVFGTFISILLIILIIMTFIAR